MGVILALLAVYIIWGSTYFAISITLESMPPMLMAGTRFLAAGSLLYLLLRSRGISAPDRGQWANAALIGILLLIGGNGGVVLAEQWVASGLAALGVATVPLWTALFGGIWGRWPGALEWGGIGLGLVGVLLLNLEQDMRASPLGAILLLGAAISWALGTVWSRHLRMPGGLMSSAAQMLSASVGFFLLGVMRGERIVTPPTGRSLLALLYLIIFGALVAFSAYTYLLNHVRPTLAASYAYVNPAVAVALGVGIGGEQIGLPGILALVVILASVGLVALGRERRVAVPSR
jgi:drug/metabolite transporter (DMT)-like permease